MPGRLFQQLSGANLATALAPGCLWWKNKNICTDRQKKNLKSLFLFFIAERRLALLPTTSEGILNFKSDAFVPSRPAINFTNSGGTFRTLRKPLKPRS